jgi:hypothetical protein
VIRFLPLALLLALAGCYSAGESLLSDDMLVTPYQVIEYVDKADELHVRHTLVRDGNSYVATADDGSISQRLRLMEVEPDWYVVEATTGDSDNPAPSYGYVHVSTAKEEAEVYASNSDDNAGLDPGYTCGTDICFDELDDYRQFAEDKIRNGAEPDSVYYVTLTE